MVLELSLIHSFTERHRHRYEFNPAYREELENAGMVISAVNDEHGLVAVSYTHLDVYKRQGKRSRQQAGAS